MQHIWQIKMHKILFMKSEGKRSYGRPRYWKKWLKCTLQKSGVKMWTGSAGSG